MLYHAWSYGLLRVEPKVLWIPGKNPAHLATAPAPKTCKFGVMIVSAPVDTYE